MRDYRDVIGGAALVLGGGLAALYALLSLRLGTIWQMGPGMFPAAVGVLLAMVGAIIAAGGLFRRGQQIDIDLRSLALISLSILAFGLLIQPFGLVPAIVALIFIASRADSKLTLIKAAVLAVGLSIAAILIFQVGLRISLAAFKWPW